ncbi:hypothetical protein BRARA_K01225 [Brassica rapa]|uniref:DUF4283 domain-containing protein n=1 Tax=Brassica campestris TaxID=3711 RepID=A0A397KW05_BRACM|nr:hypothetical protein BRARA_K01225 [Brassica rapa]
MSEDDVPIVLPEDDDFSAVERSSRSLLGRLLNPQCQNMARMLRTMPKIWKVYERVRGIALTKESFQFIFDLETDLQTVLKHGFWTFDDWGMVMERWVEQPPRNFLQTAMVWLRLRNIPGNYLTIKTIDAVAGGIGYVKVIEWDPEKPLLQDYIRVQVVMDLSLPVRDKKCLTLPKGGGSALIDVEYERIRKKCYHCLRLSHEKQTCPLLKGNLAGRSKGKEKQIIPSSQRLAQRQHNTQLSTDIMPLFAPSVPPGFAPPAGLIAPEVFEQMQLYMNCIDPEERRIREFRMKKALDELSKDSIAQRACLRMENAPMISGATNKDKGLVFDYRRVTVDTPPDTRFDRVQSRGYDSVENCAKRRPRSTEQDEGDTFGMPPVPVLGGFEIGCGASMVASKNGENRGTSRKTASWTRRGKNNTHSRKQQAVKDTDESQLKRKAEEEVEVTSKMSKSTTGLMVHQKPSNPQ